MPIPDRRAVAAEMWVLWHVFGVNPEPGLRAMESSDGTIEFRALWEHLDVRSCEMPAVMSFADRLA